MKDTTLWIRVKNPTDRDDVQDFILSLAEEDILGDIEVTLYIEEARAKCRLSHIYDISEQAIPVLKERYGDENVKVTESKIVGFSPVFTPTPDPLSRIADALERIADNLDSMEQSLEVQSSIISNAEVKNRYGSAIAITGSIDTI